MKNHPSLPMQYESCDGTVFHECRFTDNFGSIERGVEYDDVEIDVAKGKLRTLDMRGQVEDVVDIRILPK